jgi:hypothetical protein
VKALSARRLPRAACVLACVVLVLTAFAEVGQHAMASQPQPVPIVYYYTEGCHECQAVDALLKPLIAAHRVEVRVTYDAVDVAGTGLRSALDTAYGVDAEERGVVPVIFIGRRALVREAQIRSDLEPYLATITQQDIAYFETALASASTGAPNTGAQDAFKTFSVLTVLGAGMLDGINPCAFATLIFFISYLIIRSKSKRDILVVGLTFGAGVFVAYLAAGLGLYQVVSRARWFFALAKWFYLGVGIFTLVLAVASVIDIIRIRRTGLRDISLQLPDRQKRAIHSVIRRSMSTGAVATTAFVVAFPVSLFEFLCTGQTYLPTIVLIFSQDVLRARAFLLLVVYNLLFVAPLVLITVVAYLGVTSERMVGWLTRHSVLVKVLTAALFLVLSGYMLVRSLGMFGVL